LSLSTILVFGNPSVKFPLDLASKITKPAPKAANCGGLGTVWVTRSILCQLSERAHFKLVEWQAGYRRAPLGLSFGVEPPVIVLVHRSWIETDAVIVLLEWIGLPLLG